MDHSTDARPEAERGRPEAEGGRLLQLVPVPPPRQPASWPHDPDAVLAAAAILEHLVGYPPPASDTTEAADAWHERFKTAASIIAEVANADASLLRSLMAPTLDIGEVEQPGRSLLVTAAIGIERTDRAERRGR